MDRALPTIIIVVVVVVVFALIVWGWRRRVRRDIPSGGGYPFPALPATDFFSAEVWYVATTHENEPLNRLTPQGLRFRGRASLSCSREGMSVAVKGEEPVFIPTDALLDVGLANVAIDRVVEPGGLVRITWKTSGSVTAETYLRVSDPQRGELLKALETLTSHSPTVAETTKHHQLKTKEA